MTDLLDTVNNVDVSSSIMGNYIYQHSSYPDDIYINRQAPEGTYELTFLVGLRYETDDELEYMNNEQTVEIVILEKCTPGLVQPIGLLSSYSHYINMDNTKIDFVGVENGNCEWSSTFSIACARCGLTNQSDLMTRLGGTYVAEQIT